MVSAESHGSGPPLILIHGLGTSRQSWRHNVDPLAQHFRVYNLDLDGFGRNAEGYFELSESWKKVRTWLEQNGIGQADFVGHSLGGRIAAELAVEAPDCVRKLVLCDAAGVATQRSKPAQVAGIAGELSQTPARLMELVVKGTLKAGVSEVLRVAEQLSHEDIEEKLPRITQPTLVIWGKEDHTLPLSLGRRMHRKIPGSRFVVLKHAGHSPQWEAADEFNRAVCDFLLDGTQSE